jgi:hypothetical protein
MNQELNLSADALELFVTETNCFSEQVPEAAMALATAEYWRTDINA